MPSTTPERLPLQVPPTLTITGVRAGFVLRDPRIGQGVHASQVAHVFERDASQAAPAIDIEEALRRAQLFAAAETLATAAASVLELIDRMLGEKNLAHEVEILRTVLDMAMPQPIVQRQGVPA